MQASKMIEWGITPNGALRLGEFPFVDGILVSFASDRNARLLSIASQRDDLRVRCTVHITDTVRVDASFMDDDVISGFHVFEVSGDEVLSSFHLIYNNYAHADRYGAIRRAMKLAKPLYFIRVTGNMGGDYCALAGGMALESVST